MFYKQWNAESVFYWEDSCWGSCNWNPSQFTWGEGQWHAALCTHLCSYSGSLLTVDEWLSVVRKLNPGTEVIDKHCYKSTLPDCRCLLCCSCQIVLQPSSAPSIDALNIFFILKAGPRNVFLFFWFYFYLTKSSLIYACFGGNGTGYKFCAGEQKGKQTHPSAWESTAVFEQLGDGQTFATVKVAVRHPALYLPPGWTAKHEPPLVIISLLSARRPIGSERKANVSGQFAKRCHCVTVLLCCSTRDLETAF